MSQKTLSRRAALLRVGALAGAAYAAPAFTTMSMAHASGHSDASASSASSASSGSSASSAASEASASSASSAASEASMASRPSGAVSDPGVQACVDSTTTDAEFDQCLQDAGIDRSAF